MPTNTRLHLRAPLFSAAALTGSASNRRELAWPGRLPLVHTQALQASGVHGCATMDRCNNKRANSSHMSVS